MLMSVFAAAAVAAAAPSPAGPEPHAPSQKKEAASHEVAARRLLDILGSGDDALARSFFATSFSSGTPDSEPADRTLTRLLALTRQSGGIEIAKWEAEGNRFFFEGTTRRHSIPVQGMIGVSDGKIAAFDLQRNPLARGEGAPAWPPAAATAAEAVRAIEREIDWRARTGRFSGAVLLAHRGKPVLERAWGLARRGPDVAATPETLFGTASATKMLTSVAVARLVDRGKLSFDAKVAEAVPALASAPGADRVTLRDLLGHRVDYGEYFSETHQDPLIARHVRATELLPLLGRGEPKRAPAGRIAYSNGNYLVLAAAIEAASGRSFYDFVGDDILRPLSMVRTGYDIGAGRPEGLAVGWIKDEVRDPLGLGEWESNQGRNGGSRGGPAGGAWSTARDMWILLDSLSSGRLVRPETLQAMWGDRIRVGPKLGAALGFMFRGGETPTFFGHSGGGGNAGVSTAIYTSPDREWAVVVLSNFSSPSGEMLGGQIMDYLGTLPRR